MCRWLWMVCLTPSGINFKDMLISEFIQQLKDLCDNEGDMEIVMITDSNSFGSEPHLRKSSFYDQFEITNH